jgi:NADH:ubiquinone oxidoreductase subunit F (NADH-binding)
MESAQLPRVLAGWRPGEPLAHDEHTAIHGPLATPHRRPNLLDELERSGLRGRGGAGFPAATKVRAVAGARGRSVLLANGAEGEPASRKDRALMAGAPHLVIDGALLAATAVGARQVTFAIKDTSQKALAAIEAAIRERRDLDPFDVSVVEAPGNYVAGEETALVNYLNTGRALPTFVPPRPYERGVEGRPTLVQNVETLAHVALIARRGSDWFRQVGVAEDPGSNLVTLLGAVARPGVYEIESGTSVSTLVDAAGGASEPLRAFLLGGYGGAWAPAPRAAGLGLGRAEQTATALGAGVIVALPESACGVCETARLLGYLAAESAGQCGPCVYGVGAIAEAFAEIADRTASPGTHRWIERWSEDVAGRGACGHPDGAALLAASALFAFRDDIARHEAGERCPASAGGPWTLPLPDPVEALR